MKSVVSLVDVMKVSDEESLLLTGETAYDKAALQLLSRGPKLVAVTLGGDGVLLVSKEHQEMIPLFGQRLWIPPVQEIPSGVDS